MIRILLICVTFMFHMAIVFGMTPASMPENSFQKAQREYLCSWAALASYDDKYSLLARSELEKRGCRIQKYNQTNNSADSKCYIIHEPAGSSQSAVTVFAVTGTENMHDVKTDLRYGKVPFHKDAAGHTTAGIHGEVPMVHKGFDDYTTLTWECRLPDGSTMGDFFYQKLKNHPKEHLIVTGHSLGGAVATLFAARLADKGIPQEQLSVITFGAPAVGNRAFVDSYKNKFVLDRVVVKGDIVNSVLQNLVGGYYQFPEKTLWRQGEDVQRFQHDITGYVDAALRNYYDCFDRLPKTSTIKQWHTPLSVSLPVYIAPFSFSLADSLLGDQYYMESSIKDILKDRYPHAVFAVPGQAKDMAGLCAAARLAGCKYIVSDTFTGRRIVNKKYDFAMGTQEEVYDVDGNLLYLQGKVTDTSFLTPIETFLYNLVTLEEEREMVLLKKVAA